MTNTHPSRSGLRPNALLAMPAGERERFLADVHVGIVAHNTSAPGTPLASPVSYSYEPGGDVVSVTAGAPPAVRRTIACRYMPRTPSTRSSR